MAVNEIHDPEICPNPKLKTVNEIHRALDDVHLTQLTVSEGFDSSLACQLLLNFRLQISALLHLINACAYESK